MAELFVIVMAGGKGQRFWPFSRIQRPKQCLPITSEKPMIVETIDRFFPLVSHERVFISTGSHLADHIRSQLPNVNYIIEPIGRDTAACITLSALKIQHDFPNTDSILVIAGSDYNIPLEDKVQFHNDLRLATKLAEQGYIVTLGIPPSRPATQYGYIHKGTSLPELSHSQVYTVKEFVEKPNEEVAKSYIQSGQHLWNSGMFIAKTETMLSEIKCFMPDMYETIYKAKEKDFDPDALIKAFHSIKDPKSIDYGVMERTKKLVLVETSFRWDDIGDWLSLERILPKDEAGNIIHGKANFLGLKTKNCIISSLMPEHIVTLGCKDLVIVQAEDCLFIASKREVEDLKLLLKKVNEENLEFLT
ncbi:MAG: mannose-1-phosphate guanylyltransferase [Candidatus Hodarchaeota archaeon]